MLIIFVNKGKMNNLNEVWNLLKPEKKNEYLEIRITNRYNVSDRAYYDVVNDFKYKNPEIIVRNGCQFFIQKKEHMQLIIEWNEGFFRDNCKICYGITLRECKDLMKINGSYDCIKNIRFVFFDIELKSHSMPTQAQSEMLDEYVLFVAKDLEDRGLKQPTIIHSGAGRHLLYKIAPTKITDAKIRGYKTFIEGVKEKLDNDLFEIDDVKDLTRVFGLPGSKNVKREKDVYPIRIAVELNDFKIPSERKKKFLFVDDSKAYRFPEIRQSLEWKIITHPKVPVGDVHSTLLFSLKLLLKARGVTEYLSLERELNSVRGTKHKLDPYKGTENKSWSPGIIINWAKRNKQWCENYNIQWADYGNICKKLKSKKKA